MRKSLMVMNAFCVDGLNNRFTKYGVIMARGTLAATTLGQPYRGNVDSTAFCLASIQETMNVEEPEPHLDRT